MRFLFILIIFFVFYFSGFSQTVVFEKTFATGGADAGYDVIESLDGHLIIAGTLSKRNLTGNWVNDAILIKMNKLGDTVWTKVFGGNSNDFFTSLLELPDGYLLTGSTISFSTHGSADLLLMKVDKNGNKIWTKTFGGSNRDQGNKLIELSDGNIMIAGLTESMGAGGMDAYLIKTDTAGNMIWEETYGGSQTDDAWDVAETVDGGYLFTGGTYSFASGTMDDGWIVKVNAQGAEQWKKTFGVANQQDWFWSIEPAGNDEYVLSGVLDNSNNPLTSGLHFIKVDGSGNLIWDKSFGMGHGYQGNDIKQLPDGGFVIGGVRLTPARFEFLFIRTTAQGDTLWTKGFGTNQTLNRIFGITVNSIGHITGTGIINQTGVASPDLHVVHLMDVSTGFAFSPTKESINVYPNPMFNRHLYFDGASDNAVFYLYGLTGAQLQISVVVNGQTTINRSIGKGIYLYKIFDQAERQASAGKLVIH